MVGGALAMVGLSAELDRYDDEGLSRHLLELAHELLDRHVGKG